VSLSLSTRECSLASSCNIANSQELRRGEAIVGAALRGRPFRTDYAGAATEGRPYNRDEEGTDVARVSDVDARFLSTELG